MIEHVEDRGLEDVCYQLELLGCGDSLNFGLTIVIEPQEIPVLMLILVEPLEISGACFHCRRNGASWLVVNWPVSGGKNFNTEFDSIDLC